MIDPLWTIPLVGLVIAFLGGIVALLDYLSTNKNKQLHHHKRA
ncbi:MAG: hypothetical protein ABIH50_06720 [bacterium]